MFKNLSTYLIDIIRKIIIKKHINKKNIKYLLNDIKIALIEADVALLLVQKLINIINKTISKKYLKNKYILSKDFIKTIYDELILVMGNNCNNLTILNKSLTIILVIGLQGAGKTTFICKLGKYLYKKNKKKILIVSTDIYRPGAVSQLEILSKSVNIDFYKFSNHKNPVDIAFLSLKYARSKLYDILLVDTSGRLHTNEVMMKEIKDIYFVLCPIETLFVMDAMTGQDAINVVKIFNNQIKITGIVLAKTDGDTKCGVALSIKYITNKPIKFISFGEKLNTLELFYPDRFVSRILGMGDVKSLLENIKTNINFKKTNKIINKIIKGDNLNYNDFLDQIKQIKKLGGVNNIFEKLPGINYFKNNFKSKFNEENLIKLEIIINSMTIKERNNPKIINKLCKYRISIGSGVKIYYLNNLLKQFNNICKTIKTLNNNNILDLFKNIFKYKFN